MTIEEIEKVLFQTQELKLTGEERNRIEKKLQFPE